MVRIVGGALAVILIVTAIIFIWKAKAGTANIAAAPTVSSVPTAAAPASFDPLDVAAPPQASDATREAKRFNRFDSNRDGRIGADEYLQTRRKAYAKLDSDGDGRLSFEEFAVKAIDKFRTSDRDRSGQLNASEFAATRPPRNKARPQRCPPTLRPVQAAGEDDG